MKQKRKHILKKLFIFGVAFMLASCSEDLYDESQNDSKNTYSIKRVPLNELAIDQKFNTAYKKVSHKSLSNEIAVFSRTQIENEYGFTIVDEPSNVMDYNNKTSYSLQIQMDSTQADELKNLVIEVNNLNESKHFIVTYKLDENAAYRLSEGEPIVVEEIAFDPILAVSSRYRADCFDVTTIYCTAAGTPQYCGGADTQYGCYSRTITLCTGGVSNNGAGFVGNGVLASPVDTNHGHGGGGGNDLGIPLTPCAKAKKAFTKLPTLRTELSGMSGKTGETTEWGRFKTTNASVIQTPSSTASGEVSFPIPSNGQYTMMAHTHNSPANTTYSVFSWADLEALATLVRNEKVDTDNFVAFLATADGTYYAFTIEDPEAFAQFFATALDTGFDPAIGQKRADQMNKYFDPGKKFNPIIKENNTDNLADQKAFLDFMQDNNIGASLFESNSTFTTFDKVTHNKTTSNVDKQPCN